MEINVRKGEIYMITNLNNDKKYIGQTVQGYLTRWRQHKCASKSEKSKRRCVALNRAILKHGCESFKIEVIETINIHIIDKKTIKQDADKLNELEVIYIKKYNTLVPNGYNIQKGNKYSENTMIGNFLSEEHKNKISIANTGKKHSEDTKKKISEKMAGANHHLYNKLISSETKNKISETQRIKNGNKLPMYISEMKAYPKNNQAGGYFVDHPKGKKSFTSKKLTMDEKLNLAIQCVETLNSLI